MRQRVYETLVGLFMLLGIVALIFLALKVSGLSSQNFADGYTITADFSNVGALKVRSPVSIAGVNVGRVTEIDLDQNSFQARVTMTLNVDAKNIPDDSTASILTEGLLGSNYIGLTPGYSTDYLKQGSKLENTQSAIILENLISQFMFNVGKSK